MDNFFFFFYNSFKYQIIYIFFFFFQRLKNNYENKRVAKILTAYRKILDYLLDKDACLAHVSPEFLLDYDDYLANVKEVKDKPNFFFLLLNFNNKKKKFRKHERITLNYYRSWYSSRAVNNPGSISSCSVTSILH